MRIRNHRDSLGTSWGFQWCNSCLDLLVLVHVTRFREEHQRLLGIDIREPVSNEEMLFVVSGNLRGGYFLPVHVLVGREGNVLPLSDLGLPGLHVGERALPEVCGVQRSSLEQSEFIRPNRLVQLKLEQLLLRYIVPSIRDLPPLAVLLILDIPLDLEDLEVVVGVWVLIGFRGIVRVEIPKRASPYSFLYGVQLLSLLWMIRVSEVIIDERPHIPFTKRLLF